VLIHSPRRSKETPLLPILNQNNPTISFILLNIAREIPGRHLDQ